MAKVNIAAAEAERIRDEDCGPEGCPAPAQVDPELAKARAEAEMAKARAEASLDAAGLGHLSKFKDPEPKPEILFKDGIEMGRASKYVALEFLSTSRKNDIKRGHVFIFRPGEWLPAALGDETLAKLASISPSVVHDMESGPYPGPAAHLLRKAPVTPKGRLVPRNEGSRREGGPTSRTYIPSAGADNE